MAHANKAVTKSYQAQYYERVIKGNPDRLKKHRESANRYRRERGGKERRLELAVKEKDERYKNARKQLLGWKDGRAVILYRETTESRLTIGQGGKWWVDIMDAHQDPDTPGNTVIIGDHFLGSDFLTQDGRKP